MCARPLQKAQVTLRRLCFAMFCSVVVYVAYLIYGTVDVNRYVAYAVHANVYINLLSGKMLRRLLNLQMLT